MAKKSSSSSRQPLVQAPPPANSSSSISSSEENSSSSSDEEDATHLPQTQTTQSINKLINTTPLTPKPHVSESSDESSESDTDTDTPPPPKSKPIPQTQQPQVSKPKYDTESDTDTDTPLAKVKSSKPKPTIAALPSAVKSTTSASASTAKKGKVGVKEEGVTVPGTPGKALFQRLFSEEDEIAILKGMIEYKEKKGKDPLVDGDGFTRFIVERGLDVVEVKKDQLVNKVKRLKKKFETAKKKKKISGAHDVACFELSKKIWGSEGEEENGDVVVVKKEKKKDEKKGGENVVVKENGGEKEEWRGMKRCESGGGGEKRKKGVKAELEEEILRLGEVQWSEMAADVKYLDDETSVEVLERVKRRRVRKLEGMLEDLDEMRFVTLKAIESYKASLKK